MKKNIIAIPAMIIMSIFFMSNRAGRGNVANAPSTTAPGENGQTCATVGCHSAGNFDPSLELVLVDANNNVVENFLPGESYSVNITINTTGSPNAYGFQMVALDQDDNQAGEWDEANLPASTGLVNLLDRSYVEQRDRLSSPEISIPWTAPMEASNVSFYVAGNAVNGNSSPGGDGATTASFTFEQMSSNTEENSFGTVQVFPNPVQDVMSINNVGKVDIQVFDMNGLQLIQDFQTDKVNLINLQSGVYILQLSKGAEIHFSKFIKL